MRISKLRRKTMHSGELSFNLRYENRVGSLPRFQNLKTVRMERTLEFRSLKLYLDR